MLQGELDESEIAVRDQRGLHQSHAQIQAPSADCCFESQSAPAKLDLRQRGKSESGLSALGRQSLDIAFRVNPTRSEFVGFR